MPVEHRPSGVPGTPGPGPDPERVGHVAIAAPGTRLVPPRPAPGAPRAAPRTAVGVLCTAVALAAIVPLVRDAATASSAAEPTPVDVRVSGTVSTAGLASGPVVSRLTVVNTGPGPVAWHWHPEVAGTPAVAARASLTAWTPSSGRCDEPAPPLAAGAPSPAPLAPGDTASLCVRLALPPDALATPGRLTPAVRVDAVPA